MQRTFTLQLAVALWVGILFVAATPAHAEEQSYSSKVVQNRKHLGTHEFTAQVGVLALDAFTKGITFGGAYTLHFTEHLAWEVINGLYSVHADTSLKDELKALDVRATPFEVLDFALMTNFVFKPFYWKASWLDNRLLYGEFLFNIGGGYGWYTRSSRVGLNVGTGARFYLSELLSLRFDMRYLLFFDDTILEDFSYKDDLWLTLGLSLSF